ncbi:Bifunctional transcriptional activator/DNA repair enzyme AdaA [Jeotgalibaca dankookensis]|uniref:Bifunctional transcriptional activator/DNA repair enzyme AdaA n=1 Tax=Jeotgalibaca dankookensis TaxID=708126 RepID=A0A1S6IQA0_9LACT|nr:AraC family transcriptional regulator [Jeotgalibaca dankookensis]AQS53718.1 Bifunctional transcriptional activator/DNA repair enzyme AdaA [Jeotgalibaca dankookensis]
MSNRVYEIAAPTEEKISTKVFYVTEAKYEHDWHSTFHSHFFTELIYVTKGKGYFMVPNKKFPIQEKSLIIVNENVDHTEMSDPDGKLEYIAIGIQDILFSSKHSDQFESFFIYNITKDLKIINELFNIILLEAKRNLDSNADITKNLLEVLLVYLNRNNSIEFNKTDQSVVNKNISLIKHHIDNNFQDSLTLDDLATIGHMNKYYLAHTFKSTLGMSPIEYLNEVRINRSRYLLGSTDHPISMIAGFAGFSSPSYFSQSFKRKTGYTPIQYRTLQKKGHQSKKE